jgi:hypothetical protein
MKKQIKVRSSKAREREYKFIAKYVFVLVDGSRSGRGVAVGRAKNKVEFAKMVNRKAKIDGDVRHIVDIIIFSEERREAALSWSRSVNN